jgi:hypothetical protein
MKSIKAFVLLLLVSLCTRASAQEAPFTKAPPDKPDLFKQYNNRIPFTQDEINKVFNFAAGQTVSINLAPGFKVDGIVVTAEDKPGNIRAVLIESSNFPGARFVISRTKMKDNTLHYVGHLLSMQHGDLYELRTENNQYFLIKKKFNEAIME